MTTLKDIHVLVVDDSRQMRVLVRSLLRSAGLTDVSEAPSVAQAVEVLNSRAVDLVIVDWMMHPAGGLELTRLIRWTDETPDPYVPILMLTAHTETSRVAAARDAGVTGFIKKPISTRLLFHHVSSALTDSRLFIRTEDFFGPDRRRGVVVDYPGPFRRALDRTGGIDLVDLEDVA